jgi:beta-galactosidase
MATYIGCIPSQAIMKEVLRHAVKKAKLWGVNQELSFPLIIKEGMNQEGKLLHYYFNYSEENHAFTYPHQPGKELLDDSKVETGQTLNIQPWGVLIIEEL